MPRFTLILFCARYLCTSVTILSVILLTLSCREKSSGFIEIYGDSFLSVCSMDIPHAPPASCWHQLILFGLAIVTGLLPIAPVCCRIDG